MAISAEATPVGLAIHSSTGPTMPRSQTARNTEPVAHPFAYDGLCGRTSLNERCRHFKNHAPVEAARICRSGRWLTSATRVCDMGRASTLRVTGSFNMRRILSRLRPPLDPHEVPYSPTLRAQAGSEALPERRPTRLRSTRGAERGTGTSAFCCDVASTRVSQLRWRCRYTLCLDLARPQLPHGEPLFIYPGAALRLIITNARTVWCRVSRICSRLRFSTANPCVDIECFHLGDRC